MLYMVVRIRGRNLNESAFENGAKKIKVFFDILEFGIDASKFDDYERQFYERQKAQVWIPGELH